MRALERGHNAFCPGQAQSGLEGFFIGGGNIFGPAGIMQGRMLRPYRSVVQAGRNGVGESDLAVVVLQDVRVGALQNAGRTTAESRRVIAEEGTAATSFHDFWLANAHDALYPARGSVIADSASGVDGTHVGEELDAQLIYTPTRQTQIDFGYGRVIPGYFLKKTTQGVAYSYPYMQVEYVF